MREWLASKLSGLVLLVIEIGGIHSDKDLILVAGNRGRREGRYAAA
jgi:hypothetical protein